jgi:hypothetical protein
LAKAKKTYFYLKSFLMRLLKLTALSILFIVITSLITSCEKDPDGRELDRFVKTEIPMTGAQETPANPSVAQGSLDVNYTKGSKVLSYSFRWSGLADTITGIHIHGLAPTGYAAGIVQNILTSKNEAVFPFRKRKTS